MLRRTRIKHIFPLRFGMDKRTVPVRFAASEFGPKVEAVFNLWMIWLAADNDTPAPKLTAFWTDVGSRRNERCAIAISAKPISGPTSKEPSSYVDGFEEPWEGDVG